MTIRILADREPYSAFADVPRSDGGTSASAGLVILSGPAALDDPSPDIVVMPAEDYLTLSRHPSKSSCPRSLFIAYGSVSLMEKSFEHGCADYLREPWSLPELQARSRRLYRPKFRSGERTLELSGSRLVSESASVDLTESERELLRLLVLNLPSPIPKEAAFLSLAGSMRANKTALCRCVTSLRGKMDTVEKGLGERLLAIRGFGYRLDATSCG